jgi:hypothetical protein
MKLKFLLLGILLLGLYACPGDNDETFFEISSVAVNNVKAGSGENLENNASLKWNLFAIKLSFNTKELAAVNRWCGKANMAMAAVYNRPKPSSEIINLKIEYSNNTGAINLTNLFSVYQFKEPCSETIDCLNYLASVQFDKRSIGNYHYLKFEKEPDINLPKGYFVVTMELENGTILRDSTQTITITP